MATEPHFQLTTGDLSILQAMLERREGKHDPFTQLLERKVRDSTIYLRDDIPPGVVTLNTRLTYTVDGLRRGPRLLVRSESHTLPDYALSIHTLRGLALLGLMQGGSVTIDAGAGVMEDLRVETVLFQPEADARLRKTTHGTSAEHGGNVVGFMRRPDTPAPRSADPDDDPDPAAA